MSGDVPLAGRAEELTKVGAGGAIRRAAADAEGPGLWDAYFAVCWLGVLTLTLLASGARPATDRWFAAGLLAAMAVWYIGFGRSLVGRERAHTRGLLFQGLLLAMFVAAMYVGNASSFLLFGLCPLVYMTVPMRFAHPIVALYAFAPAVLTAIFGDASTLRVAVPLSVVVFTVSTIIAITMARTERSNADRGRLIEELDATRAEVARLSRAAGVAEERQRLAGEIHDTVAQGLSSVVMLVEAADVELTTDPQKARAHLALAARTARENLDEARAIVAALTPSSLAESSLVDALDRLRARHVGPQAAVGFDCEGSPRPLPTSAEVVLLRVAQESLTNVRKHAAAAHAKVRLRYGPYLVCLEIADDGRGFDPAELRHGYGLDAMRARAEQVGGRLTIHSEPGKGTTVRMEIDA